MSEEKIDLKQQKDLKEFFGLLTKAIRSGQLSFSTVYNIIVFHSPKLSQEYKSWCYDIQEGYNNMLKDMDKRLKALEEIQEEADGEPVAELEESETESKDQKSDN